MYTFTFNKRSHIVCHSEYECEIIKLELFGDKLYINITLYY